MTLKLILRSGVGLTKLAAVCVALGYLLGMFVLGCCRVEPQQAFNLAAANIRFSEPVHQGAEALGVDNGVILFLHNAVFAGLLIAPLFLAGWGRLEWLFHSGGRGKPGRTWSGRLGRTMVRAMGLAPDTSERIVHLSCLLNVANRMVIGITTLLLGLACAAGERILQSLALLAACLAPHAVVELPALFIAAGLPLALFACLASETERDGAADTFSISRRAVRSRSVLATTVAVFAALFVASQIEDKLTPMVVGYVRPNLEKLEPRAEPAREPAR